MKTPKREYKGSLVCPATGELNEYVTDVQETRWKRKNRVKQLKRTIARLTKELAAARESCDYLCAAYIENERCTRALYEYIMRERKKRPETAESGRQTDLPPTGGQQDRKGQR